MILLTGGRASGRKTYLRGLGYTDADMIDAAEVGLKGLCASAAPVVTGVSELVMELPAADVLDGKAAGDAALDELLGLLLSREAVICTEMGSGVVPLGRAERVSRDRAGALAARLAARSACCVRMVCGIPQVLRGEAPHGGRPA